MIRKNNPVLLAVKYLGSQSELARLCSVTQPAVFQWIKNGYIPAKYVLLVEKVTGIKREKLNKCFAEINLRKHN